MRRRRGTRGSTAIRSVWSLAARFGRQLYWLQSAPAAKGPWRLVARFGEDVYWLQDPPS